MTARLMLSLKSAAANPTEEWSLKTMSFVTPTVIFAGGGNRYSVPLTVGVSHKILDVSRVPDEDDFELAFMP